MKKQVNRKKLVLTTQTVHQLGETSFDSVVGGAPASSATQYGVAPCGTLHCKPNCE